MCCPTRWSVRVFAILLLLATGGSLASRAQDPPPARCCFSNPGYSGLCEVQPAKDETCQQILDYLNNPRAQGKSYCENSQLRGGWEAKACSQK